MNFVKFFVVDTFKQGYQPLYQGVHITYFNDMVFIFRLRLVQILCPVFEQSTNRMVIQVAWKFLSDINRENFYEMDPR